MKIILRERQGRFGGKTKRGGPLTSGDVYESGHSPGEDEEGRPPYSKNETQKARKRRALDIENTS